jgi:hypothetical protein
VKPKAAGLLPEADTGMFPFHYGAEADEYTFYRIPKLLFEEPTLKKISTDAKLLYGLMLDRMSISRKNGWLDEDGRVFIYFSVEHIMEMIGCGNAKCTKLLQELDSRNGVGLITRVKQGQGKPDVIYVHKCVPGISKSNPQTFQNHISGDVEMESLDISFCNANKNKINNTDFSENNLFYSEGDGSDVDKRILERNQYRDLIKSNIGYEYLVEPWNRQSLDEIVELMVDTICTTQDYIIIGGDQKPASVVKSQFLKLDSEHIRFVLDSMKENTSRVRNIRKYLLSVLYNASMTIDNYYSARVNHDLYGG